MNHYDFTMSITKEAGELLSRRTNEIFDVGEKDNDPRNSITSVDLEINTLLVNAIKKEFPTHGIYSEESEEKKTTSEFLWVIDPIDGTSNFIHHLPHFAICVGLLKNMIPVAGAVYNPVTRELFSFKKDGGAYLNGKQIFVSKVTDISRAFVFLSSGRKQESRDWGILVYGKLLNLALKTSNFSGSALDTCFVAAGRIEANIYGQLTTMDIASAIGILTEAGGKIVDKKGNPITLSKTPQKVIMANNEEIIKILLKII